MSGSLQLVGKLMDQPETKGNPHFDAMRTPFVIGNVAAMNEEMKNKIAELMTLMNTIDPEPAAAAKTEKDKPE